MENSRKNLQDALIKNKKYIVIFLIIFISICIIGLVFASIYDYQIWQYLSNPDQFFSGYLLNNYGESIAYIPNVVFWLTLSVWMFKKFYKKWWAWIFIVLFLSTAAIFGFFFSRSWFKATPAPISFTILFNVIFFAVTFFILFKISSTNFSRFLFYIILIYMMTTLAYLIMLFFKEVWGRVRPRDLNGDFTHWFIPNGVGNGESFFSGHVQAAASLAMIWFLIPIFKIKNKIVIWIMFLIPIPYTIIMVYARIVADAHFLSDGIFGILNLTCCTLFVLWIMYGKWPAKIKTKFKQAVMRKALLKRKKNAEFDEVESEKYQLTTDSPLDINNSYYFSAHNHDGTSLFFRLGKRGSKNKAIAEVWVALRLADGTAFVNKNDHMLLSKSTAFVKCIEPLRKWEFMFKGEMIPVIPDENLIAKPTGQTVKAELLATFTSESSLYEFSRDTDARSLAKAISAEKWNKEFFKQLQYSHQIHAEQEGQVEGTFKIGTNEHKIKSFAVRDHSYGRRVWSYMNQHTWLSAILEDGTTVNTNSVRYPALNTLGLRTGYKTKNNNTLNIIDYQENFNTNTIPVEGNYKLIYDDKSVDVCSYKLQIAFPFHFKDDQGSYIIYEGISNFDINGEKGIGITEFGFNNSNDSNKTE